MHAAPDAAGEHTHEHGICESYSGSKRLAAPQHRAGRAGNKNTQGGHAGDGHEAPAHATPTAVTLTDSAAESARAFATLFCCNFWNPSEFMLTRVLTTWTVLWSSHAHLPHMLCSVVLPSSNLACVRHVCAHAAMPGD